MLRAIADGDAAKPYDPPADEDLLRAAAYSGEPFVILNDNIPLFTEAEKAQTAVFETYAPLDSLGRCGVAYANLCRELMPTEDRESISSVTPTGWHNQQYDHVSGGWVYNRCHIIGFQLAGEQANKQNLITGTRYLNVEGMLPFENMVADYIKETDNHVLYRATPIFDGDNLLAEGVRIEAWSVEDSGEGIAFHVFCYNVQPGVTFDYATGENYADGTTPPAEDGEDTPTGTLYILNTNTKKFHYESCASAKKITEKYRAEYTGSRDELIADGYAPCGNCDP
ncbi:MAG: DNA/RNA non-specific endonuclease [Clostridia bacterium]|nr:DNA/RNA non-specific endonuclease [Clostridia bacterium]